jgi:hypothetical protein
LRTASLLIAGRNDVKLRPLPRALRARNVNPRKVNDVCAKASRRLPSLQYTIRVLAGCSRSPTSASLSAIALTSILAWRSLTQCTTASSTQAFEPDGRVLPGHPGVQRIVQKQVRQHGRDRRPLWGTAVSLLQGAVG